MKYALTRYRGHNFRVLKYFIAQQPEWATCHCDDIFKFRSHSFVDIDVIDTRSKKFLTN